MFLSQRLLVCLALSFVTATVFLPVRHHDFVNFDDDVFLLENPYLRHGLTPQAFRWAFLADLTHDVPHADYWRPLSYLSHALDVSLFGLAPGKHHLMSVGIHIAAALALFLVLEAMTARRWPSALVAALFALHPLHVESVAWIAERKDVLSGLFFILAIGAYTNYARSSTFRLGRYLLVVFLFVLALMSKPIAVTFPFLLLLLDYWPLRRVEWLAAVPQPSIWERIRSFVARNFLLLFEKLPLFALSTALCVATFWAQKSGGAMSSLEGTSLSSRLGNAVASYGTYVWKTFWPANLAVLYPFPPDGPALSTVILSSILLIVISTLAFALRRAHPYLAVGWLWYLGLLVPVIGIVQVGSQARADRYTYLPQIGIFIVLVWGASELAASSKRRRKLAGCAAAAMLAAFTALTSKQLVHWRNSESLWTHTVACTKQNPIAHNSLGTTLLQKGQIEEAVVHYREALRIKPAYSLAHSNLGNALLHKGRVEEAIAEYREALRIDPAFVEARNDLGDALFHKGQVEEAIAQYREVLRIKSAFVVGHYNLGVALMQKGQVEEAIAEYREALWINPDYAEAHNNLGTVLLQKGQVEKAIAEYREALRINPDYAQAMSNLAWILATAGDGRLRDGGKALKMAQKANELTKGDNPMFLGTLAAAYAEMGRFDEAQDTAGWAIELAKVQGNPTLASTLQEHLKLYQTRQPLRSGPIY